MGRRSEAAFATVRCFFITDMGIEDISPATQICMGCVSVDDLNLPTCFPQAPEARRQDRCIP